MEKSSADIRSCRFYDKAQVGCGLRLPQERLLIRCGGAAGRKPGSGSVLTARICRPHARVCTRVCTGLINKEKARWSRANRETAAARVPPTSIRLVPLPGFRRRRETCAVLVPIAVTLFIR